MRPSVRLSSLRALDDALSVVEDGMTLGIGGAVTAGHPMALVPGLVRRGVRGLTVLAPLAVHASRSDQQADLDPARRRSARTPRGAR